MLKLTNRKSLLHLLDMLYEKALTGLPGTGTAIELGDSYLKQEGTLRRQVDTLIRMQNIKAGSSGFLTGLGGIITLPVTFPANLVSVLYIQIRMVAAIAYMGGFDLRDDRVKTLVYLCLAGNAAKDILQEAGILLGKNLTSRLIGNISAKTIQAINQKVGITLLSKSGGKGIINPVKAVPLAGGLIGGAFDAALTNVIGNTARGIFIPKTPAR
ncbi:hypothetical protein SDC9_26670 [bioreactor metagenome]|jgi:uncharacterized protein (DUF697 family)|uniref:EcsC protein family protein n=1 Tax=bioreactor metagenome TaxID=1076179 RepID=A0A644UP92_9ZZZZ|nr:EcsC family protein [Lentimicrobium sp.]MEA5111150.1 EcsC family protein [Lentimicrobium sp.]